jgi:lantibiotic modifying enzyme
VGAPAARAAAVVGDIAAALRPEPARRGRAEEPSLASGQAGLAVLHAYLDRARLGAGAAEHSRRFLESAADAVATTRMGPDLYGGFTGIAWALEHLERSPRRGDDLNEDVDAALSEHLAQSPWSGDYDLVSGLAGFGVYALERLPRRPARRLLAQVVARLDELAEDTADGITWHTAPELLPEHQRAQCPGGYYNLGLAHGIPAVIAVLAGASAAGVATPTARRLLAGATRWLAARAQRRGRSVYPAWLVPGTPETSCRSAWCYGDPGVAAALLCAARATRDRRGVRDALALARRAAARPSRDAGVRDAGLCHGAAGLGQLFNRMHQATGDPALGRAARYWLLRTLALRRPGHGVAGYASYLPHPDGRVEWTPDRGLLTGAAGIALALLAAIAPVEPAWDRMLLVSLPPAAAARRRASAR